MIGLLGLLACGGPRPEDALTWRESWELLGALEDGTTIDARASVGNTGLLRGQGHLRLERWNPHEGAIITGADAPPGVVTLDDDRRSLRMGRDGVWREDDGSWRYALVGAELGATLTLLPELEPAPPATTLEGGGQRSAEAPVPLGELTGWLESGKRGGLMRGRGVLVHRGGDGRAQGARLAAWALGPGLGIGVDTEGGLTLGWAGVDGRLLDASDAKLSGDAEGKVTLDFRPASEVWVTLRPRPPAGERDPYEHLLGFERALAGWLAPVEPRRLTRALAEVHVGDSTRTVPGLILRGGD